MSYKDAKNDIEERHPGELTVNPIFLGPFLEGLQQVEFARLNIHISGAASCLMVAQTARAFE
jgi:hypothetical protein